MDKNIKDTKLLILQNPIKIYVPILTNTKESLDRQELYEKLGLFKKYEESELEVQNAWIDLDFKILITSIDYENCSFIQYHNGDSYVIALPIEELNELIDYIIKKHQC